MRVIQEILENSCLVVSYFGCWRVIQEFLEGSFGKLFRELCKNLGEILWASYFESYSMVLGKFFWKVILRVIQEILENSCLVVSYFGCWRVIQEFLEGSFGKLFRELCKNLGEILWASYFESYSMVLGKFFWKVILRVIQEFLENSCLVANYFGCWRVIQEFLESSFGKLF